MMRVLCATTFVHPVKHTCVGELSHRQVDTGSYFSDTTHLWRNPDNLICRVPNVSELTRVVRDQRGYYLENYETV